MRLDGQAQLMVRQGALYRRLGDPVKAIESYEKAQALFASNPHADGEIHTNTLHTMFTPGGISGFSYYN